MVRLHPPDRPRPNRRGNPRRHIGSRPPDPPLPGPACSASRPQPPGPSSLPTAAPSAPRRSIPAPASSPPSIYTSAGRFQLSRLSLRVLARKRFSAGHGRVSGAPCGRRRSASGRSRPGPNSPGRAPLRASRTSIRAIASSSSRVRPSFVPALTQLTTRADLVGIQFSRSSSLWMSRDRVRVGSGGIRPPARSLVAGGCADADGSNSGGWPFCDAYFNDLVVSDTAADPRRSPRV